MESAHATAPQVKMHLRNLKNPNDPEHQISGAGGPPTGSQPQRKTRSGWVTFFVILAKQKTVASLIDSHGSSLNPSRCNAEEKTDLG